MDKNKFFLFSFFLCCFVGLVGFAMVKTVFLLYDLPAWVSSSALKVFLSLGMSCFTETVDVSDEGLLQLLLVGSSDTHGGDSIVCCSS